MNNNSNDQLNDDFLHNLNVAAVVESPDNQERRGGKMLLQGLNRHIDKKENKTKIFENIGTIIFLIFVLVWILNYYDYIWHWFADIFSGKCYWWSLGFICTSG